MKIDIIIPCFKAHKVLPKLLGSIISQTISSDLVVTIVNDGDSTDYKSIIKHFKPFIEIHEIKLDTNLGPGAARRIGYEKTKNPLVMWADADDTFANAFAIQKLRESILNEEENAICIGNFVEEETIIINPNQPQMTLHQNDMIWLFGKIYKRDFLDKYTIRMNDTRANEDNGFNTLCKILSNENNRLKFIADTVYIWHYNPDSITRVNNNDYTYNTSIVGYVDNMIWVFEELERISKEHDLSSYKDRIIYEKVSILINLYYIYLETLKFEPKYVEQCLEYCKKYYDVVYKNTEDNVSEEMFNGIWQEIMYEVLNDAKLQSIMPSISIYNFIDLLK